MVPLGIFKNIFQYSQALRSLVLHNVRSFSIEKTESPAVFAKHLKERLAELNSEFLKSSGPGGQNVNKRSTKVRIKFNIGNCHWLSENAKQRLEQQYDNRINKEGELVLECQDFRTQEQNHARVLKRLKDMIEVANESEGNLSKQTIRKLKEEKRYLQRRSRSVRKHRLIAARKKEENEKVERETNNLKPPQD